MKNRTYLIKAVQAFGNVLKNESTKYNKVDVSFLAPAVALAVIQTRDIVNQDYNMPDGSKGGAKGDTGEAIIGLTLVKKSNDWKITSLQVTSVDQNTAPFNPVKEFCVIS